MFSNSNVLQTHVKVSFLAEIGMKGLTRKDRRRLKRILAGLRNKSLLNVIGAVFSPEIREEFRTGSTIAHVMPCCIAFFRLKNSVLHLLRVVAASSALVFRDFGYTTLREMDESQQFNSLLHATNKPSSRFKRKLL